MELVSRVGLVIDEWPINDYHLSFRIQSESLSIKTNHYQSLSIKSNHIQNSQPIAIVRWFISDCIGSIPRDSIWQDAWWQQSLKSERTLEFAHSDSETLLGNIDAGTLCYHDM